MSPLSHALTQAATNLERATQARETGVMDFGDSVLEDSKASEGIQDRGENANEKRDEVVAPAGLRQHTMVVSAKWRLSALVAFMKDHAHEKV